MRVALPALPGVHLFGRIDEPPHEGQQPAGQVQAPPQIRRHHGADGAARVYREVLTDASPPAAAHVVEPALGRRGRG